MNTPQEAKRISSMNGSLRGKESRTRTPYYGHQKKLPLGWGNFHLCNDMAGKEVS